MPLTVIRHLPILDCGPILHRLYMDPKPQDCEPEWVEKYLTERAQEDVDKFIQEFPEFTKAKFTYQYYSPHSDLIRA